jgi:hypothetical protein
VGKVYRVGSVHGTEYCNTAREADRCRPGGEFPESVICLGAAGECNRQERHIVEAERTINRLRILLRDLVSECSWDTIYKTEAGRAAKKFVQEHPLPPEDAADRDGQRSYGG